MGRIEQGQVRIAHPPNTNDKPISSLGLKNRTTNGLLRVGLAYVNQVQRIPIGPTVQPELPLVDLNERLPAYLYDIRSLGPLALTELLDALRNAGCPHPQDQDARRWIAARWPARYRRSAEKANA